MTDTLKALGFGVSGTAMLVEPPDRVLAEAGGLKPRPSVASSMMTAEPVEVLAWWPEPETITEAALARVRWMLETRGGTVWLVLEPATDAVAVQARLAGAGLVAAESLVLETGEPALRAVLEAAPAAD